MADTPIANSPTTAQAPPDNTPQPAADNGTLVDNAQKAADQVMQGGQASTPAQQSQQPAQPTQGPAQKPQQPHDIFRSLLETLAGPSYSYKWNADKGKMEQVPNARTKGQLSKSIIAGALTGMFAGAGEKGPGNELRAFGKGGQATVAANQQQDKDAKDQAQADLSRQQAVFENNMRAMNNGVVYSRANKDEHDQRAAAWKSQVDDIAENSPDSVIGLDNPLSEKDAMDIKKYPPQEYDRKPYGSTPRLDQNGKPVYVNFDGQVVPEGTPGSYNPYDNTYVLVKKDAKTNISDANGVKPWLSNAVNKWGGIIPGANPSLLAGDGAKGQISAYTAGRMQHQVDALDRLQSELGTFSQTLNAGKGADAKDRVADIDLKKAIQDGKVSLKDVENFQKAAVNSTQPDIQIDALRQQHPDSANRITALFNQEGDNLENYKQLRTARLQATEARQKAAQVLNENDAQFVLSHPNEFSKDVLDTATRFTAGEVDLKKAETKAQEEAKAEVEAANQRQLDQYLAGPEVEIPENFGSLTPEKMKQYLESKGVKVPPEFNALYSVGVDNTQPLNKAFPTRLSAKTGQMDDQHALAFIQKYINPNWHDSDYDAAKEFNTRLADPQKSPVIAAGVAAQHLDMLRDAGKALQNGDLQALNNLAGILHTATGSDKYVVFKAIADQVNNEVGKVIAGGPPHETELGQLRENLNSKQAWEQIDGVIKGYLGLMGGRLNELQDSSQQYFRRDLRVNPTVTKLMQKYGVDTTWSRQPGNNQQQQTTQPGTVPNGKFAAKNAQGQIIGYADDPKGTNFVKFQ